MNKEQFIRELRQRLKHLPAEDREDAISYYEDYFLDAGIGEQDVLQIVAPPKKIAADIISQSAKKQVEREDKSVKGSMRTVWIVLLAVLASPVAIPSAIVAGALMLTAGCVIFAVLLTVVCVIFAVIVSSIAGLGLIAEGAGIGQFVLSFGCLLIGIAVLLLVGTLAVQLFKKIATALFRANEHGKEMKGDSYE